MSAGEPVHDLTMADATPAPAGRDTAVPGGGRPGPGEWKPLVALALVVLVGFGATVRPGVLWWGMDDLTAYVVHGRNLLSGLPYEAIETVRDPGLPAAHLRTSFPPVLPVIIGVTERLVGQRGPEPGFVEEVLPSGASLRVEQRAPGDDDPTRPYELPVLVFKRVLVAFLALAALLWGRVLRRELPALVALGVVAAFVLHPYVHAFRELVRAEFVYLALLGGWFLCLTRMDEEREDGRDAWGTAALAGVLLYLAYATRSAAMVLVPTLLVWDVLRWRRLRITSFVLLGVAGLGWFLQQQALGSVESGYADQAQDLFGLHTVIQNAQQLRWKFERLWDPGAGDAGSAVAGVLMLLASGLAALGGLARLRRPSLLDVYGAGYLAMLLLLPTHSAWLRYLLPWLPVFGLWVASGLLVLGRSSFGAWVPRAAALGLVVLYALAWPAAYAAEPDDEGLTDPETREAFAWVTELVGPDEPVLFSKNRTLTLATGRPSLLYPMLYSHGDLGDEVITRHFEAVDLRWMLLKHSAPKAVGPYGMLDHSDREFLQGVPDEETGALQAGWAAAHADELREVRRNADYVLFEWER